jgi:hypothetical protein
MLVKPARQPTTPPIKWRHEERDGSGPGRSGVDDGAGHDVRLPIQASTVGVPSSSRRGPCQSRNSSSPLDVL